MKAEDVGWTGDNLVIGKHSGKHAVTAMLEEEGFRLDGDQIRKITEKVKDLADKQKMVERDDVIAIARDVTNQLSEEEQYVKIEEFAVFTGSNMTPTASIKLRVFGDVKIASGTGDGPVDAVSNAIWQAIDPSLKLVEYNLKAITGGTDALADVSIKLSDELDNMFMARALDEDVIKASVKAIIKGINKALSFKEKNIQRN